MTTQGFVNRFKTGLWHENPGLVQLLGLCPLLAVTSTFVNGLGLGIATLSVLVVSNGLVSATRRWIRDEIRIPIYVLIIASLVTCTELIFKAWFPALDRSLGIFIPLIVTNCAIIGRAESFAAKNSVPKALADGLTMGLGFTVALVTLGAIREAVGHGTLLAQAHLMFGEQARQLTITLVEDYRGFLLMVLPPGAFIGLGVLIALKNVVDRHMDRRIARQRATKLAAAGMTS